VDYATSGPDVALHKKYSNYIFAGACGGLALVLMLLVLLDIKKKSGKTDRSIGTAKG